MEYDGERITEAEALEMIESGSKRITDADIEKVMRREKDIKKRFHGPLGRFLEDGRTLLDMVKDYWKKRYRQVPWWTVAAAVTALLYVLNPMDAVPDFLPFLGLIDDATVLSVCLYLLDRDLSRYRSWKSEGVPEGTEED